MKRKPLLQSLGGSCLVVVLTACGAGPLAETARNGNLADLRAQLERRAAATPSMEADEVLELAEALLEREVTAADGEPGLARMRDVRACARRIEGVLKRRAEADDSAAAAGAYYVLLDARLIGHAKLFHDYSRDRRAEWQAVAARAAVGDRFAKARRRYFLAPDLRVRRAALYAALDEPAAEDADALLDVARHDPDTLVRSVALQTLGAVGGESVVAALRDLWPQATAELRQAMVGAWARPAAYRTGGAVQIRWVMGTQTGLAALVAARALLIDPAADGGLQAAARARLLHALGSGTTDEARLAAAILPVDSHTAPALLEAAGEADAPVAVVIWGRLLAEGLHAKQARDQLADMLSSSDANVAEAARRQLARVKDPAALPFVRKAASAEAPDTRVNAGLQLWDYELTTEAAALLGDPAGAVRARLACGLLAAGKP